MPSNSDIIMFSTRGIIDETAQIKMPSPLDHFRLIGFVIISFGIFVYLFFRPKEMKAAYEARFFLFAIGLLLMLISIIEICEVAGHWDYAFIFAFLTFKEVSKETGIGGVYMLRGMAYAMFEVAVIGRILGRKKNDAR
jgi:hypothetical protein